MTTPYQVAFHVPKITSDTITTTAAKLSFGTATYDVGSNYSDANDIFTAPVAGKYFFYAVQVPTVHCIIHNASPGILFHYLSFFLLLFLHG